MSEPTDRELEERVDIAREEIDGLRERDGDDSESGEQHGADQREDLKAATERVLSERRRGSLAANDEEGRG